MIGLGANSMGLGRLLLLAVCLHRRTLRRLSQAEYLTLHRGSLGLHLICRVAYALKQCL